MSRIRKISLHKHQKHEGVAAKSKLKTAEDKRSKNAKIGTAVVAFILIASIMGYMWMDTDETVNYEKFRFTRKTDRWYSKDFRMDFDFHPFSVEDIKVSTDLKKDLLGKYMVAFAYDLDETNKEAIARSIFILQEFLQEKKNTYIGLGALYENEYDLPVVSCANSTFETPLVIFKTSNETLIKNDREYASCIIFTAKTPIEFARLTDRALYELLGVME